ncbi:hypothetical protein [Desulfosporosinus sp. BG]|uniref:hypothetical protein n=1 Tax=Desulfosporosinus sp. BG TaxID=1633135 RepID=UPI00083ACD77|nr:hypothetical protein [Desulfosporosinus sp. BG]ODA39698.1 hypothetical protein DSBG_3555 [Desulfosporosinus sp. BG]
MLEKNSLWTRDFLLVDLTSFLVFASFYYLLSTLQYYVLQLGGSVASGGLIMGIFMLRKHSAMSRCLYSSASGDAKFNKM